MMLLLQNRVKGVVSSVVGESEGTGRTEGDSETRKEEEEEFNGFLERKVNWLPLGKGHDMK